jgi:hypothetical protein
MRIDEGNPFQLVEQPLFQFTGHRGRFCKIRCSKQKSRHNFRSVAAEETTIKAHGDSNLR